MLTNGTRFIAMAALLSFSGCDCNGKTVVSPIATGASRGANIIDIYGKWTRTHDPLTRTPKSWQYQFQYVPTGTEVYSDGTTDGQSLQPLDAGTVTWAITGPARDLGNPVASTTPDANGFASITLAFAPPGRGSATLKVSITYGRPTSATGTDSTQFEVDSSVP